MIGLVYDYDSFHIKIMAENIRKIIYFKDSKEFQDMCNRGMRINADVIFDTDEILEFL
mgnify:FL=1